MGAGILILPFERLSEYGAEERIHAFWREKVSRAKTDPKKMQEYAAGYLASRLQEMLNKDFDIELGEHGKPLAKTSGESVYFNISHTKGLAVLAYSENSEVGVDTERVRKAPERIAERYFTREEHLFLREGEEDGSLAERFFRIWTAKEACMKYTGDGLLLSPEKIALSGLTCRFDREDHQSFQARIQREDPPDINLTQHLYQNVRSERFVITAAWGECLSEPVKIDII